MTKLVPRTEIEQIVGCCRSRHDHIARAVSDEEVVYILHSQDCLDSGIDLRDCPFSVALDEFGIDIAWSGFEDRPVAVTVENGVLAPFCETETSA